MYYIYDHMSWQKKTKQWFVHLKVPNEQSFKNINLLLSSASNISPKNGHNYLLVTSRHQIDKSGRLFATTATNFRNTSTAPLDGAVRYATQYEFDKFCFENPDQKYSYDWNSEVYKTFISNCKLNKI